MRLQHLQWKHLLLLNVVSGKVEMNCVNRSVVLSPVCDSGVLLPEQVSVDPNVEDSIRAVDSGLLTDEQI